MPDIILLPGIGGSGSDHWQSHWEREGGAFRRFRPSDWDRPDLADWIHALDAEIAQSHEPPVLVAHSLACLLVAHWRAATRSRIAGAMLVAVPDPASPAFPAAAAGFADPPADRFHFESLIVASGNDPFGTPDYSRMRARQWGSAIVEIGDRGHINGKSGIGSWPDGRALLAEFAARRLPA
ncbi:RBBP9/YdeN family alpha/beta hydrolase [Rhizobium sp. LjRoot254]|uniref:RBBP9/YdeN family alpha/beta hydrolase n=1 Tax=Rhizobium sp. LjRoot254 TaxID=3342297 RepID=UPI003ECE9C4E